MAEPVNKSSDDTWHHEREVTGRVLMVGGVLFTLSAVGAVIGIPLMILGVYLWKDSPGPVKGVEVDE